MDDDRLHLLGVAVLVALVVGLAGAWVVDAYVMNVESEGQALQVDAEVTTAASNASGDPGSVTVAWRPVGGGDGDPPSTDHLVVEWATANGSTDATSELGHAERAVVVTDGTWRLAAVGQSVTLTERNATTVTELRLVVTAVSEDAETVVVARTVAL